MIHSLTVINTHKERLVLELTRPDLSGLAIQSISGVGAPNMDVVTASSFYDGSILGHLRAQERNIVISLFPMDYPMIETARQLTYRYFQLKTLVTLVFVLDNRIVSIAGYVESNEPDIFTNPEVIEISILCPNPYFQAFVPFHYNFYDGTPLFEFPFSNESLTEPLLEFGEVSPNNSINLDYEGDIESGITFSIYFSGKETGNIVIYNQETQESLNIHSATFTSVMSRHGLANEILGKDETAILRINTQPGEQFAVYNKRGTDYNVIPILGKNISWLTVRPGRQELVFVSDHNQETILMSVDYAPRYVGI